MERPRLIPGPVNVGQLTVSDVHRRRNGSCQKEIAREHAFVLRRHPRNSSFDEHRDRIEQANSSDEPEAHRKPDRLVSDPRETG